MRPSTQTTTFSAFALAATLALGACSAADEQTAGAPGTDGASTTQDVGGRDDAGSTDTGDATDAAAGTAGAPDQAATTLDAEDLPDPVAEVNGEPIGRDDFVAAFESQRAGAEQMAAMTGTPVDEAALADEVVDLLVDGELLQQEGERLGLKVSDEEIDAELESIVELSGAGSTEELLTLLEEQGVDEEQVREELGRLVLIDQLIVERGGVDDPSEQELKDYYEEVTGQSADGPEESGADGADNPAASAAPPAAPAFDDVRDQVSDQLVQERENDVLTALLEELREDAEITSHL